MSDSALIGDSLCGSVLKHPLNLLYDHHRGIIPYLVSPDLCVDGYDGTYAIYTPTHHHLKRKRKRREGVPFDRLTCSYRDSMHPARRDLFSDEPVATEDARMVFLEIAIWPEGASRVNVTLLELATEERSIRSMNPLHLKRRCSLY